MYRFKALCKYRNEPGCGFGWVYTDASNPYEAYQYFQAVYGNLLISGMAIRV
jgi:hypothetical protein